MSLLYLAPRLAGVHPPPPTPRSLSAPTLDMFQVRTFWILNRFGQFFLRWKALDLYFLKHPKSLKSDQKWKSSGPEHVLLWHSGELGVGGGGCTPANFAAM